MADLFNGDYYKAGASLKQRFRYHAVFGIRKEIGDRTDCPKNTVEKIGDIGFWIVENIVRIVSELVHDPKFVTIVVTVLALIVDSFLFYPERTITVVDSLFSLIPFPPFWAIRFICYITTVELILAGAFRAQGRFLNTSLMKKFYKNESST